MSKIKLQKNYRVLWVKNTKNSIEDIDDAGKDSVTECWREGIEAFESDNKEEKKEKIKTEKIKNLNETTQL